MNRDIVRRLDALEAVEAAQQVQALVVYETDGDTIEAAMARRWPGGVPADVRPLIVTVSDLVEGEAA